jgi:hypothetical protein
MEKILTEKLWDYIVANNPELMFSLQENYTVMKYLAGKVKGLQATLESLRAQEQPEYIILEICMTELTAQLKMLDQEIQDKIKKDLDSSTGTEQLLHKRSVSVGIDGRLQGDLPGREEPLPPLIIGTRLKAPALFSTGKTGYTIRVRQTSKIKI